MHTYERRLDPMRPTVIVISLCLLLGVITNVIVAWLCVLTLSDEMRSYTNEFEVNGWHGEIETGRGATGVHAISAAIESPEFLGLSSIGSWDSVAPPSWVDLDESPEESSQIDGLAVGWPWRSLHYVRQCREQRSIWDWDFDERGVVLGANPLADLSGNWVTVDRLPIAPLWAGALGNVVVFGAAWFAVALTGQPWRWRRARRRRKRNLCQHCGYEQRSSSQRCSECGLPAQGHRPLFGAPSMIALATACVLTTGAVIAFVVTFASSPPDWLIHYAAYQADVETVKEELDRGVDIEATHTFTGFLGAYYNFTPLAAAARGGDPTTVQLLIHAGADVNANRHPAGTPLALAMAHDDLEAARRLIEAGADVHALSTTITPHTVLYAAAFDGRIAGLELLIEHGFDVGTAQISLQWAVTRGHRDFVRRMLELGAPVTHDIMLAAVGSGNVQTYNLILENGGDPLSQTQRGETLLFGATSVGEGLEICRKLIDAGVDVNAAKPDGVTAFLTTLYDLELTRFLLDHDADMTATGGVGGYTALMSAVHNVEVVRLLLDRGADIAAVDDEGETAVIKAAEWGNSESLFLLLERGADPEDLRRAEIWDDEDEQRQEIIDRLLAELDEAENDGTAADGDEQ